jgi:SAM-dependent methyltransferase
MAPGTRTPIGTRSGRAAELVEAWGERAVVCDLYDDLGAPVYHDLADGDTHEVRELLSGLRTLRGPVLELAAGAGRLTMPLLAAGHDVTALELAPGMLALLGTQLAAAPPRLRARCTPVAGDMTGFDLGHRFGAVVLGTTSVSLLDETGRAGLYSSVREHLEPGGRFLLSTVDMVADGGPAEVELPFVARSGRAYRIVERWDDGDPERTATIVPVDPGAGPVVVCTTRIRVLPADLLAAELGAAGLPVLARRELAPTGTRHRGVLLDARRPA